MRKSGTQQSDENPPWKGGSERDFKVECRNFGKQSNEKSEMVLFCYLVGPNSIHQVWAVK